MNSPKSRDFAALRLAPIRVTRQAGACVKPWPLPSGLRRASRVVTRFALAVPAVVLRPSLRPMSGIFLSEDVLKQENYASKTSSIHIQHASRLNSCNDHAFRFRVHNHGGVPRPARLRFGRRPSWGAEAELTCRTTARSGYGCRHGFFDPRQNVDHTFEKSDQPSTRLMRLKATHTVH